MSQKAAPEGQNLLIIRSMFDALQVGNSQRNLLLNTQNIFAGCKIYSRHGPGGICHDLPALPRRNNPSGTQLVRGDSPASRVGSCQLPTLAFTAGD